MSIAILILLLCIASSIDLRSQIIPNRLTIPGIFLGIGLTTLSGEATLLDGILGCIIPGFVILLVAALSKGGIGGGDVKLLAMIGSFIGWRGAFNALFWGSLVGSIISILLILMGKRGRKEPIPFGPFLSLGVLLFFLIGYI